MPNNQQKLDEMYQLVKENNDTLNSLLRREKVSNLLRIVYWGAIIASLFGTYYYVQPFINTVKGEIGNVQKVMSGISDLTSGTGAPANITLPAGLPSNIDVGSVENVLKIIQDLTR